MYPNFPLFPERASRLAGQVDHVFFFTLGVSAFFSLLIAGLIFYLGVRYRRRYPSQTGYAPSQGHAPAALEIVWSIVPFAILMVMFVWGTKIYFAMARPPADVEFYVVGRQWMWKIQHPEGNREINELHVPLGVPIKLTMTSEDAIHSFYIPVFRVKTDVLPGRYSTLWFEASRLGTYHLFCAEYCGAEHSKMIGSVVVMEPHDYQAWLAGSRPAQAPSDTGEGLFVAKACNTCHRPDSAARAPILNGLFGRRVALQDGRTLVADDSYVRQSILDPQAAIVAGYQPLMPTFAGQLSEEDIVHLIAYIKTLKEPPGPALAVNTPDPDATPPSSTPRAGGAP